MSFYEAVTRANQKLSIIDKDFNKEEGWEFLFSMKQNEMFVFPNDDFDIQSIDFLDKKNASLISKHLFRVQKISSKEYMFSHHLETTVISKEDLKNKKMLKGKTYHLLKSTKYLENIVKVRINHLGEIVYVGEY